MTVINSEFKEKILRNSVFQVLYPNIASPLSFDSNEGFVNDEEVKARESRLRTALNGDAEFQVKDGVLVEVAQVYLQNHFNYTYNTSWRTYF